MLVIASGVSKVDLAVLDDWIVPIGNVNRAVGSHLDIDGAKCAMGGRNEIVNLRGSVGTAVVGQPKQVDAVPSKIGSSKDLLQLIRQVTSGERFDTAVLRLAGIEASKDA